MCVVAVVAVAMVAVAVRVPRVMPALISDNSERSGQIPTSFEQRCPVRSRCHGSTARSPCATVSRQASLWPPTLHTLSPVNDRFQRPWDKNKAGRVGCRKRGDLPCELQPKTADGNSSLEVMERQEA